MAENQVLFGTAFKNPEVKYAWELAEAVSDAALQTLKGVRNTVEAYGMTEEDFNAQEPLYLTEVRIVRRISWEDVSK